MQTKHWDRMNINVINQYSWLIISPVVIDGKMKGTEFELKAWDSCQMEELYSKIHDERQCVTCKSICLDLGVTRNVAVQMLEALPFFKAVDKGDDPVSYEVIWCVARKVGSKSGEYLLRTAFWEQRCLWKWLFSSVMVDANRIYDVKFFLLQ